jgi:hypothetical protein
MLQPPEELLVNNPRKRMMVLCKAYVKKLESITSIARIDMMDSQYSVL